MVMSSQYGLNRLGYTRNTMVFTIDTIMQIKVNL